jgi:hypothetical protein
MEFSRRASFLLIGLGVSPRRGSAAGYKNGRFWRGLDNQAKYLFLFGYGDGSGYAIATFADEKGQTIKPRLERLTPRSLTFDETVAVLDRFYAVPENGPIPIAQALELAALRAGGASESTIEERTRDYRALAARFVEH